MLNWGIEQQGFIELGGKKHSFLHFPAEQSISMRPIVLLHGWQDNAASFLPLVEAITSIISVDIYCIEFAGHGHSEHRSADAHYHFIDYVYDIQQILLALGMTDCHLVGHSMGGMVASVVAAIESNVRTLTMLEASGPLSEQADTQEQIRSAFVSRQAKGQTAVKPIADVDAFIALRARAGGLCLSHARMLIERDVAFNNDKMWRRSDIRLTALSPIRMSEAQAIDLLSKIECPTLAYFANDGYTGLYKLMGSRKKVFKNITMAYEAGHHHFHMQHPYAIAQRLINFIQEHVQE
ncbi:hypothetical protein C2869_16100 [Saccharobesus litoralis]|uniref:AB hydrolase-1 domain-containing protein n=1 Tax=Saccharobesus litoralis TaxID=2172099 RepID=A0A2S0VUF5_9ALTE|nr:alpha/beta hydrolase [Saccharobesus litoralis]AWB67854.1 hypothetical protein C2869_16100 [Saccharobesus litoralis]